MVNGEEDFVALFAANTDIAAIGSKNSVLQDFTTVRNPSDIVKFVKACSASAETVGAITFRWLSGLTAIAAKAFIVSLGEVLTFVPCHRSSIQEIGTRVAVIWRTR